MVVLALDLGQHTGWALRLPGAPILSGTVTFRPGRFEGGGMPYVRFRAWLAEMHAANALNIVVFEEVRRHLGTAAAHAFGGFLAMLTSWCEEWQIPYQGVPVQTIKKFATGKGNANKDAMIAAVVARGYNVADDNQADAIHLLRWALDQGLGGDRS